jgi:hypothetical protein
MDEFENQLNTLIETVVKAVIQAGQVKDLDNALMIRDEIQRLPNTLVTEVLNGVMLQLLAVDPELCRWFILEAFLREAPAEGKADVAERINLLLADLRA